jgi:hypothetical protein
MATTQEMSKLAGKIDHLVLKLDDVPYHSKITSEKKANLERWMASGEQLIRSIIGVTA